MPEQPDNIVPITQGARSAAEKFGAEHDRELLTILFTDLVDSTKLQSDLGNVEAARLAELHRTIVRDELAKYDAREIEWAGDSCLAAFTKPSDAIVFALKTQSAHREARRDEPKLPWVRIGMHLGEIVVRHHQDGGKHTEDLFGIQVSEASRVMSLARGNQILCTRSVFDNARSALRGAKLDGIGAVAWVNHGPYELQGSPEPVEVCEVGETEYAPLKAPEANDKCRPASAARSETKAATQLRAWHMVAACLIIGTIGVAAGRFAMPAPLVETPEPETGPSLVAEPDDVDRIVRRFKVVPPSYQELVYSSGPDVAISPDGTTMVFIADHNGVIMLHRQPVDELEATLLTGTEDAYNPMFSPDGRHVGFFSSGFIKRVAVRGGPVQNVCAAMGSFGLSWGDDGYIYFMFSNEEGLARVSASGGEPEIFLTAEPDERKSQYRWPEILPGSRQLLFTILEPGQSIEQASIALYDFESDIYEVLVDGGSHARYVETGHLVYGRAGALWGAPLDLNRRTIAGTPVILEDGLMTKSGGAADFNFSREGTLVFAPGEAAIEVPPTRLTWYDRDGRSKPFATAETLVTGLRFSPQGDRIAVARGSYGDDTNIWVYPIDGTPPTPVSFGIWQTRPVWSPDGFRIVYTAGTGTTGLDFAAADGSARDVGDPVVTPTWPDADDWTSDGKQIIYATVAAANGWDIMVLELEPEPHTRPLIQTPFNENAARLSPDNEWIAYVSDRTGRREIWVQRYPDSDAPIRVSDTSGTAPVWSPSGNELYYLQGRTIMAAPVRKTGEKLEFGASQVLFETELLSTDSTAAGYDVHPDGRFLVIERDTRFVGPGELRVVINWFEDLKRLAPIE